MTTDQIVDETDPEQRTVKARWGIVSCLDQNLVAHDGRIRPVFE
jgi:hypothetical protein